MSKMCCLIKENIKIKQLYRREFSDTFRVTINRFYNNMTGLDIIALSKYLRVPDDISMSDYVKANYGTRAVSLLKLLLTPLVRATHNNKGIK